MNRGNRNSPTHIFNVDRALVLQHILPLGLRTASGMAWFDQPHCVSRGFHLVETGANAHRLNCPTPKSNCVEALASLFANCRPIHESENIRQRQFRRDRSQNKRRIQAFDYRQHPVTIRLPPKPFDDAGEVFARAGGSMRHNSITGNVFSALHARLSNGACRPFLSDQ